MISKETLKFFKTYLNIVILEISGYVDYRKLSNNYLC